MLHSILCKHSLHAHSTHGVSECGTACLPLCSCCETSLTSWGGVLVTTQHASLHSHIMITCTMCRSSHAGCRRPKTRGGLDGRGSAATPVPHCLVQG
jgi:hypothetical protein